jgi:Ubiquitin-conjugating enzyme
MEAATAAVAASMQSSLPVFWDSSILLLVDEGRSDYMRALITGPEGTPYQDGLFVFDILLPPRYPAVPPQVKASTVWYSLLSNHPLLVYCSLSGHLPLAPLRWCDCTVASMCHVSTRWCSVPALNHRLAP